MSISPRENLLRTLRCENPQWIPVCPSLFPNQNPTRGIPPELEEVFASASASSDNLVRDILTLGEYLGANDCMLPVGKKPVDLLSDTCSERRKRVGENQLVSTLTTPAGELRQVTTFAADAPSMITERYVKTADDVLKLIEYFRSLRAEPRPEALEEIEAARNLLGERGVLFCRTAGTPLGMCYRSYFNFVDLVFLINDSPDLMDELFACMEEKYFLLYESMLRAAPAIDVFMGMDDTSTTLVSPDMFERYNVDLTTSRAALCHEHGKLYMHHSCGQIKNLLPIYRKTTMDGIDAFTVPPIGDVKYAEGRKILGGGFSIRTGLAGGFPSLRQDVISRQVADRFKDAKEAGHVVFSVGGAHLTFPAFQMIFNKALDERHPS